MGINVDLSVCVCFSLAIPAALPHSIYSSGGECVYACV